MKIRFKILAGFALIIIMLFTAGLMSIYDFSRLSNTLKALIDDNYKTIEASKTMLESLEREDSGVLLLVSGEWEKGREIIQLADSLFYSAFNIAKNNITEKDEDKYIDRIKKSYEKYKEKWEMPIVGTDKENSINWYYTDLHPNFLAAIDDVKSLMALNQDSMHGEAAELKDDTRRAIMPGIVAIIAALVFLIIFNFFISRYFVNPIENLIKTLKNCSSHTKNFDAGIKSNDELKELEKEIQNLIYKMQ